MIVNETISEQFIVFSFHTCYYENHGEILFFCKLQTKTFVPLNLIVTFLQSISHILKNGLGELYELYHKSFLDLSQIDFIFSLHHLPNIDKNFQDLQDYYRRIDPIIY